MIQITHQNLRLKEIFISISKGKTFVKSDQYSYFPWLGGNHFVYLFLYF